MNLLTVANEKFIPHCIQLIDSYNQQPFRETVHLYVFETSEITKNKILMRYNNVIIHDIPNINDYIYNPKIFLFKSYALKNMIGRKIDFIYSDSANIFARDCTAIVESLYKNKNLFLQYPIEGLKNKFWTSKKCFKEMNCETQEYFDSPQYWAGLQGYVYNELNEKFILEMYDLMLNINCAYPESNIHKPDGFSEDCLYHRNEQSVLSLLIKKYGLEQEFDYDMFNKCGDFPTMFNYDKKYSDGFDLNKVLIYPRYSNMHGLNLIDPGTLEMIMRK